MIAINIPGRGKLKIHHLVCDVNGTLAIDGRLHEGIVQRLSQLSNRLTLHLLTADTHGKQDKIDHLLNIVARRLNVGNEAEQKGNYVQALGGEHVIAFGQGANDARMLKAAAIGICVMSKEGVAIDTLNSADLLVPDIYSAFELIEKPTRLLASLRN